MKIVVFGGVGFIGTNVCIEAVKRGYQVTAFDSLIRPLTEENLPVLDQYGVEVIRGDVRNPEDLERIPKGAEGIINLSANPGIPWSLNWPMYDFKINSLGALNVLEYAKNNGRIPVIFASTNKVYSEEVNEIPIEEKETRYEWVDKTFKGIPEDFPMDAYGRYPHSPYGASKASADLYHQEYFHAFGVPTVINRMSCIYGLYQKGVADQGWVSHFVREIMFGKGKLDIFGDGKQVRDMLWGGDVAKLYLNELEAITYVAGEVFNVGGGIVNTTSLLESIGIIERFTGKKFELEYHDWRHADQKIYVSNITKVTSNPYLNWKPITPPEAGIGAMIQEAIRNGL